MGRQRVAIVGMGNCASSLLQGLALHRAGVLSSEDVGLHGVLPRRILEQVEVVCAFDIDRRKVGKSVAEALFTPPNRVPDYGGELSVYDFPILRGPVLDGVATTMSGRPKDEVFWPSSEAPADIVTALRAHRITLVLCMLPTGAHEACEAYALAACEAGAAFANGSATPLAARPEIREAFHRRGLAIIGDDFKSQFGATFLNEALIEAFTQRRCVLTASTQSNVGGNTDFLNMLERARGEVKEVSKLNALKGLPNRPDPSLMKTAISGYRPELGDTKIAELELRAEGFAHRPIKVSITLEVEDSPNAAGVITTILGGMAAGCAAAPPELGAAISTLTMKSPWRRLEDAEATAVLTRRPRPRLQKSA